MLPLFSPRRRPAVRGLLASALLAAFVAPATGADLRQVYDTALASDPVYAAARAARQAGLEQLPQARAGLLPQLGLSGNANYNDSRTRIGQGTATQRNHSDTYGYSLTLTQPLFNWANWQQFESAKLAIGVVELQFEQARQALILRIAQAYFDVLAAQDTLTALEAEQKAVLEQLAFAERNFELGTATITDTYEAQARHDQLQAQRLQAENALAVARDNLAKNLGSWPGELSRLPAGTQPPAPQPNQPQPWIDGAQAGNLLVAQTQLAAAIAARQIETARSGHYPTVNLVGSYGYNNSPFRPSTQQSAVGLDDGRNRTNSSAIGVQLAIPLYSGGGVSSRVTQAVALEDQARYDHENARREAERLARESFLGVQTGLARIRALEAAEVSSRKSLESNELGYEVGVRISLDVLNAQQQLYTTQRDLALARYEVLMAGLRLKAAAGTLAEPDLDAINALLRP